MPTTRGLERLIFFTDAVVAIAITLLILPLVDAASETRNGTETAEQFFRAEGPQIVAFLISFAVIARLLVAHHALFEHSASYNGVVILLSLVWAFTIVVLPLPTAMSAEFDSEPLTLGFYVGTMLASSLTLTLLAVTIRGDRALEASANRISPSTVRGSVITTVLFAVALVLGVAVPGVGYWGLFVLLLSGPIQVGLDRRAERPRGLQDRRLPQALHVTLVHGCTGSGRCTSGANARAGLPAYPSVGARRSLREFRGSGPPTVDRCRRRRSTFR